MRRLFLLAALAFPASVLAQVTAPAGRVIEQENYNSAIRTSYLNAEHCSGNDPVDLQWDIGASFAATGTYRLVATNTDPGANACAEQNDTAVSPQVFAASFDTAPAERQLQDKPVSGAAIAKAASRTCGAEGEGQVLFVCAHWYEGSTRRGVALGRFEVQVAVPEPPTGVSVGSGDTRLHVSWTASTSGTVVADRYVAEAKPVAGGTAVRSDPVAAQDVTISGLVNDQDYSVVVYALSVGRNESAPSAAVTGTPREVDDFWEVYRRNPDAREDGGCGTGGAGPLALVAVGALALLRRRA